MDTTGTQLAVLYREVSLIKRLNCIHFYICTYVVGIADSVLIREVSFNWSDPYREILLYVVLIWTCRQQKCE